MKRKLSKKSIYVDSNLFIYSAIYDPQAIPEAAAATTKLHQIVTGTIHAYTSTLTWDEVVWVVRKLFNPTKAAAQGASLLKLPNVKLLTADAETIAHAQAIVEEYELKPRDAIHAATALENGLHRILTFDSDFDAIPDLTRIEPSK